MKTPISLKRLVLVSAATLALSGPGLVHGASDFLLRLDGIKGESQDAKHKDEIEIQSFSWGATRTSPATGGRLAASQPCVKDIAFAKHVDKSSPLLFANAATGMHIPTATLTVRKSGGEQQEYLVFKLTDVIVSSYSGGGATGSVPTDAFSLNFAQVEVSYRAQKEDGSLDAAITTKVSGGC